MEICLCQLRVRVCVFLVEIQLAHLLVVEVVVAVLTVLWCCAWSVLLWLVLVLLFHYQLAHALPPRRWVDVHM